MIKKMGIGKKIAFLIILMYPWFAVAGIIGILGIDSVGKVAYEITDRANFVNTLNDFRFLMLKAQLASERGDKESFVAEIGLLRNKSGEAVAFLDDRLQRLGNVYNARKLLVDISREIDFISRRPPGEVRIDPLLLALDTVIKEARDNLREATFASYRRHSLSIAGLAFVTFMIIIIGAAGGAVIVRSIKTPLKKVTSIAESISELKGDLTQRLEVDTRDELSTLASSFNNMVGNLGDMIRQIKHVAARIVSGSNRIKEQAGLQAQISKNQSAQVEEAVSMMKRLGDATSKIAEDARRMVERSRENRRLAEESVSVIKGGMTGFKEIVPKIDSLVKQSLALESKSRSIDSIIDWMSDISRRLDTIAINAGIELGKKGDTKGLGEFVEETRKLSDRSEEAAREIKAIMVGVKDEIKKAASLGEASLKDLDRNLRLISHSQEAIAKIDNLINEGEGRAGSINEEAAQQERLSHDAIEGILYINQLARKSLSYSDQIQRLSIEIDALSGQLKHLISEFKVD